MTKDEAIDKVRKLLALADSTNENEAAAAAGRAADIMERYRLDAAMVAAAEQREVEADEDFSLNTTVRAEREHVRVPTWYWTVAWGAAQANRCKPYARAFMPADQWIVRMTFIGRPTDAAAARYMLDALANEIDRLAVDFLARNKRLAGRSAGKSFRLGAAYKIAERLEAQLAETPARIRGELAAAGDQGGIARLDNALALRAEDGERLDTFLEDNGISYGKARPATVSSKEAFRQGVSAGERVSLGGGHALGPGSRALRSGGDR